MFTKMVSEVEEQRRNPLNVGVHPENLLHDSHSELLRLNGGA